MGSFGLLVEAEGRSEGGSLNSDVDWLVFSILRLTAD